MPPATKNERITMEEKDFLELEEDFIVIAVPSHTVEVTITAKVFEDGELHTVQKTMDFDEVRRAFKEAHDGYIPSDAVFTLTDIAKDKLAKLLEAYTTEEEE